MVQSDATFNLDSQRSNSNSRDLIKFKNLLQKDRKAEWTEEEFNKGDVDAVSFAP